MKKNAFEIEKSGGAILKKNAPCSGQVFGHNYAGGICLVCGGSQNPAKKVSESRIDFTKRVQKKENKNIHSAIHDLTDRISSHFGERKKFGMYLGTIKRVGVQYASSIFSEIVEQQRRGAGPRDPGRLFMWKCSKKGRP